MASCLLSRNQITKLKVKENAFQRETKASLQGTAETLEHQSSFWEGLQRVWVTPALRELGH